MGAASSPLEREFLEHLQLIEAIIAFLARRHHLSSADADDFSSHVKLKLIENNYYVFREFKGRSNLRTYLTAVISHLLQDYRTSAWGKWRPSAEARRAGETAVLLERLLIRDGHSFEEACEILLTNHSVTETRTELERIAARLPMRTRRRIESDSVLLTLPAPGARPDAGVLADELQAQAGRVLEVLEALKQGLDSEDRLILALRFEDGRRVNEIARMLRLDAKPLYRRVEMLLGALRSSLEAKGIDSSCVMGLFGNEEKR